MKENKENKYPLLKLINSPKDLKNIKNLNELCMEIRDKLIEVISKNGGHLSSNLGVVELTVALNKVFDISSDDKIIWDVGHQCYVHKMLTGRFNLIDTIRKENGISGFTNIKESKYDVFTSGHSSTSVSAAIGVAESKKHLGENGKVIAVIGDGALTGGLAYEGLNNSQKCKNFILVLNDNHMSISKNVGVVAKCLTAARIGYTYRKAKNILGRILEKSTIGTKLEIFLKNSKSVLKNVIYKENIFKNMGFEYYGPVDGHDLISLEKVFIAAKNTNKPTVVHVITNKGKGYRFAERDPKNFHGVSPFNISTGKSEFKKGKETFSETFGKTLCKLAENDDKICAVTAAMTSGTGLKNFRENFRHRFYDVGIAEGHAVTFCAGLAAGGMKPVFAVYSSFLQRSYDQIIHDVSLQNLKIILAIDRAGFSGEDGEAHQGLFDVPFLNTIPNVKILCPSFLVELEKMLEEAVNSEEKNIIAIRYPKGGEPLKPENYSFKNLKYEFFGNLDSEILIVTYGRIFSHAYECYKMLKELGHEICVLKINVIKPLPEEMINKCTLFKNILFFEESVTSGAIGEKFASVIIGKNFKGNYKNYGVPNEFVPHASIHSQIKKYSLDSESIKNIVLKYFNKS